MVDAQTFKEPERKPVPLEGEDDLRVTLAAFEEAIRSRDIERILSFYVADLVAYDIVPPLRFVGREAYRKSWEIGLAMMQEGFESEIRDLHVETGGDCAFAHGLCRIKNGGNEIWMRWSSGFRKQDGKWRIAHEHISIPADMENGKALYDLKPEERLH